MNDASRNVRTSRGRSTLNKLSRVAQDLQARGADALLQLREISATLNDWGLRPFPEPPDGFRWKTRGEYASEFNDAATTTQRRSELVAIRCGLRLPETVAIPRDPQQETKPL